MTDAIAQTAAVSAQLAHDTTGPFAVLTTHFDRLMALGGPVLILLGLLSILALTVVLAKLWQFARVRVGARKPVEAAIDLWQADRRQASLERLQGASDPVSRVLLVALDGLARGLRDDVHLREEVARVAAQQIEQLRAHLRTLEVIGTISPLLGLLGTVLGMIEAFRQLEMAGSQVNPAVLSGGIWQALLTTAVGLVVAIPVTLAHTWLERRVERCAHRMEDAVTRVFTSAALAPVEPSTAPGEMPVGGRLHHAA